MKELQTNGSQEEKDDEVVWIKKFDMKLMVNRFNLMESSH